MRVFHRGRMVIANPIKSILIGLILSWVWKTSPLSSEELDDEAANPLLNYSYTSSIGFGGYWTEDRGIKAFNIPMAFRLRPIEDDQWGIKLLLPVTIGTNDIDVQDDQGNEVPLDLKTITVVPGVEFEIPMRHDWTLKPFGQIGGGKDLSADEGALIFSLGLKSSLLLPSWERFRFTLGNSLRFYGHDATNGDRQDSITIGTGLDMVFPVDLDLLGMSTNPAIYFIHYFHIKEVEFERRNAEPITVNNEVELALSLVGRDSFSLGPINLERFGLAYRYGDKVQVVRLVFRFPF